MVIENLDNLRPLAAQYDVLFHDIGDEKGTPVEEALLDLLADYDIDLIALARYIRIILPEVVLCYESRIINVHPSLLLAFLAPPHTGRLSKRAPVSPVSPPTT